MKKIEPKVSTKDTCNIHADHDHQHGPGCGHIAIKHGDHIDYLHDGHLHHMHGDHVDEHVIEISEKNPDHCTPNYSVLVMMLTMFTVPVADMKLCLMGITLTIWWTVAYIIHTMGTAMIMVP